MSKATQLSEFERGEIVGLKKTNFSYREIARILNRSKSAVEKTINDYFPRIKQLQLLDLAGFKKKTQNEKPRTKNKTELFNLLKE